MAPAGEREINVAGAESIMEMGGQPSDERPNQVFKRSFPIDPNGSEIKWPT